MAKIKSSKRASTLMRDRYIKVVYEEVMDGLGEYRFLVPKGFVYEQVRARTGYCVKKIARVVNGSDEGD